VPREDDFGTQGLFAVMFPEAVRRVERDGASAAEDSDLRADSSSDDKGLDEKYCDSQSGGHGIDSPSTFGLSLDSGVREVR
jgi:hypothetical protein